VHATPLHLVILRRKLTFDLKFAARVDRGCVHGRLFVATIARHNTDYDGRPCVDLIEDRVVCSSETLLLHDISVLLVFKG
jgi:hypothetical protein